MILIECSSAVQLKLEELFYSLLINSVHFPYTFKDYCNCSNNENKIWLLVLLVIVMLYLVFLFSLVRLQEWMTKQSAFIHHKLNTWLGWGVGVGLWGVHWVMSLPPPPPPPLVEFATHHTSFRHSLGMVSSKNPLAVFVWSL